ncbi:MAG TPA: TIGR04283 family arsenosugar biosynthesis glycosyltransferase [Hyphomicrobium sp.]
MISVVIPTLNAEASLPDTLSALIPAAVDGLVREVIIVDAGSADSTREIADAAGAEVLVASPSRGAQLAAGAARAKHHWLLFLHADTVLDVGWEREVSHFMERVDDGRAKPAAAAFRFALDDEGLAPRFLEVLVGLRCGLLRLPYGDQGLLIPRHLYDRVGGYREIPLMEDLDLVRRLGSRAVKMLRARAVTSAQRYRREGYLRRVLKNQMCRVLFALNVPAARISQFYGGAGADR